MKTIAEQLNVKEFPFEIRDKNGNTIYWENYDGDWNKYEYDEKGSLIYFEDSSGLIDGNRPKPTVELTMDDIANRLGIDVKLLKIIK